MQQIGEHLSSIDGVFEPLNDKLLSDTQRHSSIAELIECGVIICTGVGSKRGITNLQNRCFTRMYKHVVQCNRESTCLAYHISDCTTAQSARTGNYRN
jgi:hypothetical protein